MNSKSHINDEISPRETSQLETLQLNVQTTYQALSHAIKHAEYQEIGQLSPKFAKDVMVFLNTLRHVKDNHNGHTASLETCLAFMDELSDFIQTLKGLSHTYKQNDNFMHTSELRRIIENEEAQVIEIEQALLSTKDLLS